LEAELFGHVKGAFTGAVATKAGRFQLAGSGSLFLDEIGDLSPKGQGDLLRVLEDGCLRMVGGTDVVRVNVRVVAATDQGQAANRPYTERFPRDAPREAVGGRGDKVGN
jgi:transcriptional regulator with GAF, ATPase, and Fis domain